jgi:hypothetical protein
MPSPRPITGLIVGPLVLLAIAASDTVRAATIMVTSTADDGSSGTLRQPLANASDSDMIDATGTFGTILLTGAPLVGSRNVTILGPGPANLAINGNAASRVFLSHVDHRDRGRGQGGQLRERPRVHALTVAASGTFAHPMEPPEATTRCSMKDRTSAGMTSTGSGTTDRIGETSNQ